MDDGDEVRKDEDRAFILRLPPSRAREFRQMLSENNFQDLRLHVDPVARAHGHDRSVPCCALPRGPFPHARACRNADCVYWGGRDTCVGLNPRGVCCVQGRLYGPHRHLHDRRGGEQPRAGAAAPERARPPDAARKLPHHRRQVWRLYQDG